MPFFTFTHDRQTCFVYNFFLVHFFKTFSTYSKSAWNSAFFDPFFDFFKKNFFLGHISTFFKLWSQTRKKRLKKSKNVFCKCVLEIQFCTHQRVCILYFLKKVKFVVPYCTYTRIQYILFITQGRGGGGRIGKCHTDRNHEAVGGEQQWK